MEIAEARIPHNLADEGEGREARRVTHEPDSARPEPLALHLDGHRGEGRIRRRDGAHAPRVRGRQGDDVRDGMNGRAALRLLRLLLVRPGDARRLT